MRLVLRSADQPSGARCRRLNSLLYRMDLGEVKKRGPVEPGPSYTEEIDGENSQLDGCRESLTASAFGGRAMCRAVAEGLKTTDFLRLPTASFAFMELRTGFDVMTKLLSLQKILGQKYRVGRIARCPYPT